MIGENIDTLTKCESIVYCAVSVQVKEIKLRQQNWMKQRTQSLAMDCSAGVPTALVLMSGLLSCSLFTVCMCICGS